MSEVVTATAHDTDPAGYNQALGASSPLSLISPSPLDLNHNGSADSGGPHVDSDSSNAGLDPKRGDAGSPALVVDSLEINGSQTRTLGWQPCPRNPDLASNTGHGTRTKVSNKSDDLSSIASLTSEVTKMHRQNCQKRAAVMKGKRKSTRRESILRARLRTVLLSLAVQNEALDSEHQALQRQDQTLNDQEHQLDVVEITICMDSAGR